MPYTRPNATASTSSRRTQYTRRGRGRRRRVAVLTTSP
jgi:hypothetical protein